MIVSSTYYCVVTLAATGFGGFGLGQTGASTGFSLNKPATGFGAAPTGFGTTGFGAMGTAAAAQPQQPVQLAL